MHNKSDTSNNEMITDEDTYIDDDKKDKDDKKRKFKEIDDSMKSNEFIERDEIKNTKKTKFEHKNLNVNDTITSDIDTDKK